MQTAFGLAVFLACFFYNQATIAKGKAVFIWVVALQWVGAIIGIIGGIRTGWMVIRKAEDFDYV